jgi:hypothetical protein
MKCKIFQGWCSGIEALPGRPARMKRNRSRRNVQTTEEKEELNLKWQKMEEYGYRPARPAVFMV